MNKDKLLHIISLINNNFKNKFYFKTEIDNKLNNSKTILTDNINSNININTSNLKSISDIDSYVVEANNNIDNINNSINSDLDNKYNSINDSLNSKIDEYSNTLVDNTLLINKTKTKIDEVNNDLVTYIDDIKNSKVTDEYLNNKAIELENLINTYYSNAIFKLSNLGSYLGESDKYDTLPNLDIAVNPVGLNDISYLTEDDGVNKKGLYKYNGTKYIPFNPNPPLTESELYALVDKLRDDYNNIDLQNQIINANTSEITIMDSLFTDMGDFNLDISRWDVSNVVSMRYMFFSCKSFNQDLGRWDVSNVSDISGIFSHTSSFNQDISTWDTSNVTTMSSMFYYASSFNQNISNWDVNNVTIWNNFRDNCPLSDANTPPKFR